MISSSVATYRQALDTLQHQQLLGSPVVSARRPPCEAACTLNINNDVVGIKSIEHFIVDKGWDEGWIAPQVATKKPERRSPWWLRSSAQALAPPVQQLARRARCHGVREIQPHRRTCCATASRISSWRNTTSTRIAQMRGRRRVFHTGVL